MNKGKALQSKWLTAHLPALPGQGHHEAGARVCAGQEDSWEEWEWEGSHGKTSHGGKRAMAGKGKIGGQQSLEIAQQAKHGQPRNQEELDLQRLSAMGQSRFKRLADRKERRAKEEAAKQEAFQAGANWQFQLQQLQQMQQWQAHQWQAQQWQAQEWQAQQWGAVGTPTPTRLVQNT